MDLDLELFRVNGRAETSVTADVVGELTVADVELTLVEKGSAPAPLKRIGERHHALAKLLASGVKPGVAAVTVGLTPSRVSILQGDPTFIELIEFYRENVDAMYADLHTMLVGMSADAAEEIRRRLEEEPEKISFAALKDIVTLAADRTGHGPQSSQNVNVNINIADRLEAARKRMKTIEHNADG